MNWSSIIISTILRTAGCILSMAFRKAEAGCGSGAVSYTHLFILVINVNTAAQTIQQDYDSIEIYLKDDVTKEQANDIIMQVKEEKGVEDAYYKSKEAAMENFRNRWGDNAYLLDLSLIHI